MGLTPFLFFTGKGGVGKTSIACATATALADKGRKVLLVSTDPASNLQDVFDTSLTMAYKEISEVPNLFVSNLDPEEAADEYRERVVGPYRDQLPDVAVKQMEEQLSGSCTVEIAAFDTFSSMLTDRSIIQTFDQIIFDTAPTGHTLLLLDATEAYHREIAHTSGDVPVSVQHLLPRLRNPEETAVVIVTLAETTPVFEAERLAADLKRAGIVPKWWVVNQSLVAAQTNDPVLQVRAASEQTWIDRVDQDSEHHIAVVPWHEQKAPTLKN